MRDGLCFLSEEGDGCVFLFLMHLDGIESVFKGTC